ncbi:MAG: hypothetical protein Fur0022_24990 [Anaerolineales bacterium]
MHKLIILVEPPENESQFETTWPEFISLSARLPGLRRETTSRVTHSLFGNHAYTLIHELYFDTPEIARQALNSPLGVQAGQTLQRITSGHVTLLLADHLEDDPVRYTPPPAPAGP